MVELQPRAFLEQPEAEVLTQVAAANRMLREELEGADIDFMLTEDPGILFESLDSLEIGATITMCAQSFRSLELKCVTRLMQPLFA